MGTDLSHGKPRGELVGEEPLIDYIQMIAILNYYARMGS